MRYNSKLINEGEHNRLAKIDRQKHIATIHMNGVVRAECKCGWEFESGLRPVVVTAIEQHCKAAKDGVWSPATKNGSHDAHWHAEHLRKSGKAPKKVTGPNWWWQDSPMGRAERENAI